MYDIVFGLALLAGLSAIYWRALHGAFIWDDVDLIRDNRLVTAPGGLQLIWFGREAVDFWPLTNSLFWLEWKLWGAEVLGFHLVNLLLHFLNCALLLKLLRRLAIPFAAMITAVFAFHPMNVEAVAWIFQAKTLLSTSLVLGSALFFLREGLAARVASVFCFALALLAKVSVVTWPLALIVFDFHRTRSIARTLKRTSPFLALSLIVGLVNVFWYSYETVTGADAINELGALERVLLVGWTTWFYALKSFVPHPLAFLYPRWEISVSSVVDWLPLLALVAAVVSIAVKKKWRESISARALFGYWLLLFPALGLFTIYFQRYSFVADHWHYLALPILIAVVVVALGRALPAKIAVVVGAIMTLVFAGVAFEHASHFVSAEAIWSHTITRNPRAFLAYNNLGLIQYESGRRQEAETNFLRALEVKSDYREALLNLGRSRKEDGKLAEAEALYRKAIEASPRFVSAYINLGALYGTQGRASEAKAAFEKALELDPRAAVVHFNLAALYQMQGDVAATYRELGLANKVSGLEALRYGDRPKAREFLEAAAQHLPEDPDVRAGLAALSPASH